jgi:hypothetical protein
MTREVCYIDKDTGLAGTCQMEALGRDIDCHKCGFKKIYDGKESLTFSYTMWTGNLLNNQKPTGEQP